MKTQFIVHPDEITKELIDNLKINKIDCLGIHPSGGKNAYQSLESLISLLKTTAFRNLLDYAKENGISIEYELHAVGYLMPKNLFLSHPEYFRVDRNGNRNNDYNFCVSNKDALEIVCENATKLALCLYNSSPNFYFWIDDGDDVFCSCEKCKQLSASDQALIIINAIAQAVKKIIPSARFAYLAYINTLTPPTIKKDDAIFLEYAPWAKYTATGEKAKELILAEQNLLSPLLDFFGKDNAKILEYWFDNSLYSNWQKPPKKFTLNYNQMKSDIAFYKKQGFSYLSTFGCFLGRDYETLWGKADISPLFTLIKNDI